MLQGTKSTQKLPSIKGEFLKDYIGPIKQKVLYYKFMELNIL
jgi:hypothetical protein